MQQQGYYRYPAIFKDQLVFVSEGDLWKAEIGSENSKIFAQRLTVSRGAIKSPVISPAGDQIAFASSQEGGFELFVINMDGTNLTRLTYLGDEVTPLVWTSEGIYFSSSSHQPFQKWNTLWKISPKGGAPEELQIGPANFISFRPEIDNPQEANTPCVIQRHGYREYGYWKRYRGGTAGEIWVDQDGQGNFQKLLGDAALHKEGQESKEKSDRNIAGNGALSTPMQSADQARPLWVSDHKIIFSSDHEGVGNLYAIHPDGSHLKRLTNHSDFYVRNQSTDGRSVVYHAGSDLYLLDLLSEKIRKLEISYSGDRQGRLRKSFAAERYLQGYHLHPKGQHLVVNTRGKLAVMGTFEGPVIQMGRHDEIRYREPVWLPDGKSLLVVADDAGESFLEIHYLDNIDTPKRLNFTTDLGRVDALFTARGYKSAQSEEEVIRVILYNHRHEVIALDLDGQEAHVIDQSTNGFISRGHWSPDGRWFAYGAYKDRRKAVIKLYDAQEGQVHQITDTMLTDSYPVFDPAGKYLYFIGDRHFDPVPDHFQFEHAFPFGAKIYALALQKDLPSPFLKLPESLFENSTQEHDKKPSKENQETKNDKEGEEDDDSLPKRPDPIEIDLVGIGHRFIEFPIEAGNYSDLVAARGKLYFLSHPIHGALEAAEQQEEMKPSLEMFDLESLKGENVLHNVDDIDLALDGETLIIQSGRKLRILKAGEKPDDEANSGANRKTGPIDLSRIRLLVTPSTEWQQMFKEAWRLQRDHYWVEDMSHINWQGVYERYAPLLTRVSTREEFSDLVWEMQGELGTSHAYVMGGDLKRPPSMPMGSLGAQFKWDKEHQGYAIFDLKVGDPFDTHASSPLAQVGANLKEGDLIQAIDGVSLSASCTPESCLVSKADRVVALKVLRREAKEAEIIYVKPLAHFYHANYRSWVEENRRKVHESSKGKVGYIHIPDMSSYGYAEFHRSFLQELDKPGLIVDVRFNGGGSVSQLLIEKLARRRLGYDITRYMGSVPYPEEAPMGPMVCITNEYAGSDGDMFSQVFKLLKLGPLIGKRTWGGVIGIWPRYGLVDGGITTQPEFSFWFKDIGWGVENHGVDPDIEIEMRPQDYASGQDPQLEKALNLVAHDIKEHVKENVDPYPDMAQRPSLEFSGKLLAG